MTSVQPNSTSSAQRSQVEKLLQSNTTDNLGFQVVWAVIRVAVGLLMIHNGLDKLEDVAGFADGVIKFMGFPYPVFLTYCAAYTEIIGSSLLIVGALTRFSALSLLFTMSIAVYFHLKKTGLQLPPLETASLYGLFFLFFVVNGGGKFSADAFLTQRSKKA